MTLWGTGWDEGGACIPKRGIPRLRQSSPLPPLQLQHTMSSPTAGTVAFVHINPTQPLSCKESLSEFSQPTHQGPAGTDSCLPSGDVHVSSWSHPMPSSPLAAFLSLHRQEFFPISEDLFWLFRNREGSSSSHWQGWSRLHLPGLSSRDLP